MWTRKKVDLGTPRSPEVIPIRLDSDSFGKLSESVAHTIGSAKFLLIQTLVVAVWMGWNRLGPSEWRFDTPQFILLNLLFSTQAAYAAPLILLAETRQAERDRAESNQDRERAALVKADLDYLAREIASLRLRVLDSDDLNRLEGKLDKLLEPKD